MKNAVSWWLAAFPLVLGIRFYRQGLHYMTTNGKTTVIDGIEMELPAPDVSLTEYAKTQSRLPGEDNATFLARCAKAVQALAREHANDAPSPPPERTGNAPSVVATRSSATLGPSVAPTQSMTSGDPVPSYDWRRILSLSPTDENTFLWEFCSAVEREPTPTEYNLFLGCQMLGLVAGYDVVAEDSPNVAAVFGLVLVGRTGTGKSKSTDHALALLRKVWPQQSNGTGVHIHGSVFSGQKIVDALNHREADPSNPKAPSIPVPQRALFEYPEFSEVASGSANQGSILKTKIHELLDGKSGKPIMYQSMGAGAVEAESPFGSIITTTQTERIRDLLKKNDKASGFMNRFLFLLGQEKPGRARGKVSIDLTASEEQLLLVRGYITTKMRCLTWEPDADELWEKVYQITVQTLKEQDTNDILTRLDLHIKRLILAFAINERSDTIQRHHVQMAVELVPYLVQCFGRVIGALLMTEDKEICEWLLDKIRVMEQKERAKGNNETPGPSAADIRHYYKHKGWEDWRVRRALDSLVGVDALIRKEQAGKRGQKAHRYYVVDY